MALYRFKTEKEAIRLANDCDVGLGSFIITESISRSWRVAEALEVGMVGVNIGLLSACENPFGGKSKTAAVGLVHIDADDKCSLAGVKQSGYGREGGREGILEYVAVKSIFINVAN